MKVLILGAGAMGCLYGAAFHRGGAAVTLVDVDRDHLAAINEHGLELETRAGIEHLPIPALLPEQVGDVADLIVVFTKTFQTDAALEGISAAIGPETWLLSLQNGLGNDERLARHAAREWVMVGVSTLPADLVGPGKVRSHGEGGTKLYPAFAPDAGPVHSVCKALESGGLSATPDPQIHAAIWAKAIFNAAMNPLCALTLRTPGFLAAHQESRALIHAVVEEGTATAKANGIPIDSAPIHALTEISMTDHANHEASMLQDVKACRRTEVDAINGAIVQAAKASGVAVPVTETLWRLVKLEEAKLAG
jgi:2-dehydropantoate 2-reductase